MKLLKRLPEFVFGRALLVGDFAKVDVGKPKKTTGVDSVKCRFVWETPYLAVKQKCIFKRGNRSYNCGNLATVADALRELDLDVGIHL